MSEEYDRGFLDGYAKGIQASHKALERLQTKPIKVSRSQKDWLVDRLHLSIRTQNALKQARICTFGELTRNSVEQLLSIDGFGPVSIEQITEQLATYGLSLREQEPVLVLREYHDDEPDTEKPMVEDSDHTPIHKALILNARITNCFAHEKINTLEQLLKYTPEQLLGIHNFGNRCLGIVVKELSKRELSLSER